MTNTQNQLKRITANLMVITLVAFLPYDATAVTAGRVTSFLNTIGVNTKISQGVDNSTRLIEPIRYMGIRQLRDDAAENELIALHEATGVRFCITGMDTGKGRNLAAAGALLAYEGPNEPNNWPITYNGQTGGGSGTWLPLAYYQRDLYALIKADPVLKNYPVFSASEMGAQTDNCGLQFLTIPAGYSCLMPAGTKYADYANVHNYAVGVGMTALVDNTAWNAAATTENIAPWDGIYGNHGVTWGKHFTGYSVSQLATLPRVTTETGWHTAGENGSLSQASQGKLILNIFLAQFKRGWSYTYIYEMKDQNTPSWGLLDSNYNYKLSATYLHNFTTILDDKDSMIPGQLNYSIASQPTTVHDLLLQKSNGKFELIVWSEKVSGTSAVTVNLGATCASVKVFDPTIGTTPGQTLSNVSAVNLTLSDHPVILEIMVNANQPYFQNIPSGVYADSVVLTIEAMSGTTIHYTLDGSTPTAGSPIYSNRLAIKQSATVKAVGIAGGVSSAVVTGQTFTILRKVVQQPPYPGLNYKYYEYAAPAWDSLSRHPLASLTPVKSGAVDSFCIPAGTRNDLFALRFTGVIKIDTAGKYTFMTYSDAGSRLYIDGFCVVNNDGRHASTDYISGSVPLNKGLYPITLDYFQDSAARGLYVYFQGPAFYKKKITKSVLFCDSAYTTTSLPPPIRVAAQRVSISRLQNGIISVAVPFAGAHEIRILRTDGRTMKTIKAPSAAVHTFTRHDLKPGAYLVNIVNENKTIRRKMLVD